MSSTSQPAAMRNKGSPHSHACGDALHTECLAHHCNRTKETRAPPARWCLPPIGRSPSEISGGAGPTCARAGAIAAPPIPLFPWTNPHAAIDRDEWNRLCILSREGKRGGSTTPPASRDDGRRRMDFMDDPADACRQTEEYQARLDANRRKDLRIERLHHGHTREPRDAKHLRPDPLP